MSSRIISSILCLCKFLNVFIVQLVNVILHSHNPFGNSSFAEGWRRKDFVEVANLFKYSRNRVKFGLTSL